MAAVIRLSVKTPKCPQAAIHGVHPAGHRLGRMSATVCPAPASADAQASMLNEQKMLVKSLKEKSKRVKKLAKQITKVPTDEKIALARDMKEMIATLNQDNDDLVRLALRMAEEGYEDPDSGSSDEDTSKQMLAAGDGGITELLEFKRGQVNVCTGKACTRKGGSEQILMALASRWHADPNVDVQQCSCMGQCKQAANVELRGQATTTMVTALRPEMLSEQREKVPELDVVC